MIKDEAAALGKGNLKSKDRHYADGSKTTQTGTTTYLNQTKKERTNGSLLFCLIVRLTVLPKASHLTASGSESDAIAFH